MFTLNALFAAATAALKWSDVLLRGRFDNATMRRRATEVKEAAVDILSCAMVVDEIMHIALESRCHLLLEHCA